MSRDERLHKLLPAIYRIRDAEHSEPLRALMGVLEGQLELLEGDIDGLYDDWFIETCEEWVVPYIGDLLGVRLLHNVKSGGIYSQRALIANTLSFRRRKGTVSMLEDLARDVTVWRAHAVAFFELLGWTQNLDHLRYELAPNPNPRSPDLLNPHAVNRVGTANLRSLDVIDRLDGPFDLLAHTVDVRPIGQLEGWQNIRNLGLFLWRLGSYPMPGVEPRRSDAYADGFHFSPLGNPAPLFTNPERKPNEKGLSTEANVPGQIRPVAFYQQPEDYYGSESDKSLALYRASKVDPDQLIPVDEVMCKDLSTWSPPPLGKVAIDVRLGRFAFAPGETPAESVTATYHYGFSADIGGGPYDRRATLEKAGSEDWQVTVAKGQPDPPPAEWRTTLADAIADWNPTLQPRAVITIADNRAYDEVLTLTLAAGQHLILQADNRNRPTVRFLDNAGDLSVLTLAGGGGEKASLTLSGLLMEGGIRIEAESLGELELIHSSLVPGLAVDEAGRPVDPGAASLDVDPDNAELEVKIESSITGPLRLPTNMTGFSVRNSIVDRPEDEAAPNESRIAIAQDDAGDEPGPPATLERTTVFGKVRVETLKLASEVIFVHSVVAQRRQEGCVRFSYVDDLLSITPRRFRCLPDLALDMRRKKLGVEVLPALIRSQMRPDFTSVRYGHPGYAQLGLWTAEEIRSGSADGAEIGVFERLKQPQREANLLVRLEEYMPYGLTAGWIYVT